jgi:hypothetical protein
MTILVLLLSVVVFAMMVRTVNLGGLIRHPELQPDFPGPEERTLDTARSVAAVKADSQLSITTGGPRR